MEGATLVTIASKADSLVCLLRASPKDDSVAPDHRDLQQLTVTNQPPKINQPRPVRRANAASR